jgi:hypothetical protein
MEYLEEIGQVARCGETVVTAIRVAVYTDTLAQQGVVGFRRGGSDATPVVGFDDD